VYYVLGEDQSDVETLKVIIRSLRADGSLRVGGKGFGSGSDLMRRGYKFLQVASAIGWDRFIICHDADEDDPSAIRARITDRVVKPSGIAAPVCIVVPVREIEAWILADLDAVSRAFPRWKPAWQPKPIPNPEGIRQPKEHLMRSSRDPNRRARYRHPADNPIVARHLDLAIVRKKCPSFVPLADFVAQAH
jgi:hypothetical protein